MTAPTPALPADLDAGLRRLRLGAMRRLAPELLITAKTQRWAPEEFLRTLIETEIASRDASNTRARLKAAAFPVTKTLDEFDLTESSIKTATFDYLITLEWIAPTRTSASSVPPAPAKPTTSSHSAAPPSTPGIASATSPPSNSSSTSTAALADNSVGRVIETICRNDLILIDEIGFAPLDDTGCQLLFRLVAAAYERRSLAIGSH